MAHQVTGKLHIHGAGDIDRACKAADLVIVFVARGDLHKERNKLTSEVTRTAVMGDRQASFRSLSLILKQLTTMRHSAMHSKGN